MTRIDSDRSQQKPVSGRQSEHDDTGLGPREALRSGGVRTVALLAAVGMVDELDGALLGVFAPEIQDTLGVSTTGLAAIATASGAIFVAGAIPIARLADRTHRGRIVAISTMFWALALACMGLVQNLFQFVMARIAIGIGKSNTMPVHGSMLADAYPERARGTIYAIHGAFAQLGRVLAPLSIAGLILLIDDEADWRRLAPIVAIAPLAMALVCAIWLREPGRGQHERVRVLGDATDSAGTDSAGTDSASTELLSDESSVSLPLAFARIRRIRTFDRLATGIGVIGFTLFSVPIFVSLVLEDTYGLSAADRSLVTTCSALASLMAVPFGAGYGGKLFATEPGAVLRLMGRALVLGSMCTAAAVFMPNAIWLTVLFALGGAVGSAAFVMLSAVVAAVVPSKLRAQGFSLIGVYVFLIGGFLGSVLAGIVADSIGTRAAIPVVVLPCALLGGYLISQAAETIDADMQRVADDLVEEAQEAQRRQHSGIVPTLQVRGLAVTIGAVPILSDISLEIGEGEIVAVVGTNGSGKSTLLRAISGLQVAERGVIRFGPMDVTLRSAHDRTRLGIVQLVGGKSSFGNLSVRENFEVGGLTLPAGLRSERIAEALALFPELEPLLDQNAERLSGGEQQMLGLARSLLLKPKLFIIDELSLGLAPIVVGRLVAALDDIRADGTSIFIVEQSLNLAASVADRVVFLDRGRVRFEGSGGDLLEKRNLARAVFLGGGA